MIKRSQGSVIMDNPFNVTLDSIRVRTDDEEFVEVVFSINNSVRSLHLIPIPVKKGLVSEENFLKQARHYFHNRMRAVAEATESWKIDRVADDTEEKP